MRWPLVIIASLHCVVACAMDPQAAALLDVSLPPHGSIGEWRMLDGQPLADESGNGYDLTLAGSATVSGGVLICSASPLSYGVVSAPTNALNFNYNEPYSVACWVRPTTHSSAADCIVARQAGPDYKGWALSFIQEGAHNRGIRAQHRNRGGTTAMTDSHTALPTNTWLHVAFSYAGDGSPPIVYVNGQTSATRTAIATLGTASTLTPTPVEVGARGGGLLPMTGQIGDVLIWPRVVSQSELWKLTMKGPPNE